MSDETQAQQQQIVCDDGVRKWLAFLVVLQFSWIVGFAQWTGRALPNDILNAEVMLTTFVLGFYFGSSSGSKAKDVKNA